SFARVFFERHWTSLASGYPEDALLARRLWLRNSSVKRGYQRSTIAELMIAPATGIWLCGASPSGLPPPFGYAIASENIANRPNAAQKSGGSPEGLTHCDRMFVFRN